MWSYTSFIYLLSLRLSTGASACIAELGGLSNIGTAEGTIGTVLTPKCGRPTVVERADGGCSITFVK